MSRRSRSVHVPLDYGNPADQRLSSYRMSMLAHGFVDSDEAGRHEFVPDTPNAMSYAVVLLRQRGSVALIATVIVIIVAVVALVLLG